MRQELSDVRAAVSGIEITLAGHTQVLAEHTQELGSLKTTARNIAVTVAGHTETLSRMEKQLSKLDTLDLISKNLTRLEPPNKQS
jgi:hypothetical protein